MREHGASSVTAPRPPGGRRSLVVLGTCIALVCSGCWRSTSGRDLRPPSGASGAVIAPATTTTRPLVVTTAVGPTLR